MRYKAKARQGAVRLIGQACLTLGNAWPIAVQGRRTRPRCCAASQTLHTDRTSDGGTGTGTVLYRVPGTDYTVPTSAAQTERSGGPSQLGWGLQGWGGARSATGGAAGLNDSATDSAGAAFARVPFPAISPARFPVRSSTSAVGYQRPRLKPGASPENRPPGKSAAGLRNAISGSRIPDRGIRSLGPAKGGRGRLGQADVYPEAAGLIRPPPRLQAAGASAPRPWDRVPAGAQQRRAAPDL